MGRIIEFPGANDVEREDADFCIVNVELVGTEIWRELIVPGDFRLDEFARALITAFEWGGSHVWYFELPEQKVFYDDPDAPEGVDATAGARHLSAADATVGQLLPDTDAILQFVYDMGDNWEMTISLSDILSADNYLFPVVPVCTGGSLAAPLEDVGGVDGWFHFCDVMENPDDPDYERLLDWSGLDDGDDFIPEAFVPHEVNELFALDLLDGQQDTLPDDVATLRDMVVALSAQLIACQADDLITADDMFNAIDAMMQGFESGDLFGAMDDFFQ